MLASEAYKTRMASIDTLKKIEPFKSDYNVYEMEIKYDYNSDNIIGNFTDTETFVKAVAAEALKNVVSILSLLQLKTDHSKILHVFYVDNVQQYVQLVH